MWRMDADYATTGHSIRRIALVVCLLAGGWSSFAQEPEIRRGERRAPDDELSRRLIRETVGEREDMMGVIVRLMSESARHLEVTFDAGTDTQAVQGEIVRNLDEAIKMAAAQRRLTKQSSPSRQGDKRRLGRESVRAERSSESKSGAASQAAEPGTVGAAGQAGSPESPGGALKETRRAWGHLPQREREELIQGSEEAFLEQYRAWIERYYQALQEAE